MSAAWRWPSSMAMLPAKVLPTSLMSGHLATAFLKPSKRSLFQAEPAGPGSVMTYAFGSCLHT
jgi:hypothetical protein